MIFMLVITSSSMYRSNRLSSAQRLYDSTSSSTLKLLRDVCLYGPVHELVEEDIVILNKVFYLEKKRRLYEKIVKS